jgi:hypothetical protein
MQILQVFACKVEMALIRISIVAMNVYSTCKAGSSSLFVLELWKFAWG